MTNVHLLGLAYALRVALRVKARVALRVALRVGMRALERTSLVEADATGVLATIAFLVVFRVLIRDFFWMVTLVSFDFFLEDLNSVVRFSLEHERCQSPSQLHKLCM